jgi:hypothetical protein
VGSHNSLATVKSRPPRKITLIAVNAIPRSHTFDNPDRDEYRYKGFWMEKVSQKLEWLGRKLPQLQLQYCITATSHTAYVQLSNNFMARAL